MQRKDDTIISRLRLGHTRLSSSLYKVGNHGTGRCFNCGQEETAERVVAHCQRYEEERERQMTQKPDRHFPIKLSK